MLAGKEKTVTAPRAQTPACPASACCAAAGETASVGFVSALNPVPTELPARSAPPALIPALLKSEFLALCLNWQKKREWRQSGPKWIHPLGAVNVQSTFHVHMSSNKCMEIQSKFYGLLASISLSVALIDRFTNHMTELKWTTDLPSPDPAPSRGKKSSAKNLRLSWLAALCSANIVPS